jgi:hypothetical protein
MVSNIDVSISEQRTPFALLKVTNAILLNELMPRAHAYTYSGRCITP